MDSYLANIDTYMQQQRQQELLLKRQRQQQLLQQQQQQHHHLQQQHSASMQNSQPLPPLGEDDWLRNMSNLSVRPASNPFYPDPTMYMSNIPNDAYTANSMSSNEYSLPQESYSQPMQSPTGYDMNGQPVRIRKKPGRKPNPASPALRKAQNRAAQRAFRERKERHLKDLETTIHNLRNQRNNATRELNALKGNLESYKAENWYLKGVVLTLQFICMHHNINIPTHSPYLSEEALAKMAQTAPHAIEAYVNSYTRNNFNLKSTMSYHFVDNNNIQEPVSSESPHSYHDQEESMDYSVTEEDYHSIASPSPQPQPQPQPQLMKEEETDSNQPAWKSSFNDATSPLHPPTSSLDAIQHIRLKLGVQSTLNNADDQAAARLKPTILQLAIPHDPRIDLIPTPHMRDRMIIFRDQMDYDRCFTMMLNEAVYHGGDPTMSESWELPADFFSEFWYLTIDYDIKKTNKWRRRKGLADVAPGPQQQQQQQQEREQQLANATKSVDWTSMLQQGGDDQVWSDEVLDQIVKGMPSLQPINQKSGYPLSPPRKFEPSTPEAIRDSPKSIYSRLMSAPESRQRVSSPSLEKMIDLINEDFP
ncbi:hypothetical protein MFLAVUS_004555 [Mucor flavus]|uniref:BZIP domain-containing protein n=1 Tax=Mucor flavus TaxID=439312 RepID=A0ABP9YW84_9FUNG